MNLVTMPAPDVSGDSFASAEEIEEFDAIARMRGSQLVLEGETVAPALDAKSLRASAMLDAIALRPAPLPPQTRVGTIEVIVGVGNNDDGTLHACDKSGPMIPVKGEYVFSCSKCGKLRA